MVTMDWILIIETVITSGTAGLLWKLYKAHKKSHEKLELSQQRQIKKDLLDMYRQAQKCSCVLIYELEIFNNLYDSYKELDGNSFMDEIHGKYNAFPLKGE